MSPKRKIRAKEFIEDLRSGLTPSQLMTKYSVSVHGLRTIFRKLLEVSAMKKREIARLANLYGDADPPPRIRRFPRKIMDFPVWVYDSVDQVEGCRVIDISKNGLRVENIRTKVGEVKTFIVRFGDRWRGRSFVFEAVCRWSDEQGKDSKRPTAGFEITRISSLDAKELEELIVG